jgi:hypothetical protein
MMHDEQVPPVQAPTTDTGAAAFEEPEVIDFGELRELTLSGSSPLSDSFGGAAGGGS